MIYATRNRLSHGYMDVDLHVVWQLVSRELPLLKDQLEALTATLAQK